MSCFPKSVEIFHLCIQIHIDFQALNQFGAVWCSELTPKRSSKLEKLFHLLSFSFLPFSFFHGKTSQRMNKFTLLTMSKPRTRGHQGVNSLVTFHGTRSEYQIRLERENDLRHTRENCEISFLFPPFCRATSEKKKVLIQSQIYF